jgi:predicted PurR-regulated permease PerM
MCVPPSLLNFGGMLFGTLGLLLTVPVLFVVFQKIQERVRKNKSIQ